MALIETTHETHHFAPPFSAPHDGRAELEAFLLTERHGLRAFALRFTRNGADADDLVQATAERALAKAHLYGPGTDAGAWLRRMMYRIFVDASRRARHLVEAVDADELPAPTHADDEQPLWQSFTVEDVRRVVGVLSPDQRAAFELFAFQRQSYEEIAARLAVPIRTVGTRILRARNRLRLALLTGHAPTPLHAPRARRPSVAHTGPQPTRRARAVAA